ncbi:hypothetical protein [Marinibacterium profundimaris]|uniref:Uncharacterized protein n=1 Tax=Marinibacterium profundimaris TaxID=1679460 RepID=A0A225NZY7_9RHOB|nr:hypothetical protein [Marinibacterium profundimaris]OWU77626.1 hypothetical protein ATO3_02795 [Marinibacterium profundimaris]
MFTPSRGEQRKLADYLDEIADEKLIGHPPGPSDPVSASRISLGAAYRLVAADMRELSEART